MNRIRRQAEYWTEWAARRPVPTPGLTIVAWLVGTAWLIQLSSVTGTGSLHEIVFTIDGAPIIVAGGPPLSVVGYIGFGIVRIYVPVTAILTVIVGELLGVGGGPRRYACQVGFGLLAAVQLLVLSGCGCGAGSVTPLGEAAAAALASSIPPLSPVSFPR